MKKPTDTPTVRNRLRTRFRRVVRRLDEGGHSRSYDAARISAELRTIVERRSAYDR